MNEAITAEQYLNIKRWLDKHLLTTIELERAIPADSITIGRSLGVNMRTNDYHHANEFCCKGDISVAHGNEIVLVGKSRDFRQLYAALRFFEDKADALNAEPFHDSCSSHISLFCKNNEIMMPDTILKNLFQIVRAFDAGIYYLTGATRNGIMRKDICRFAITPKNIDVVRLDLSGINMSVGRGSGGDTKYGVLSMRKCGISGDKFYGLDVEFRNPDGIRVPAALAAIACLKKAMLHKALRMSLEGVYSVCLDAPRITKEGYSWRESKELTQSITEGNSGLETLSRCSMQAKELIAFCEREILEQKDGEIVLDILNELAAKSISMRYMAAASVTNEFNRKLDKELLKGKRLNSVELSDTEKKVLSVLNDASLRIDTMTQLKKAITERCSLQMRSVEWNLKRIEERTGRDVAIINKCVVMRER
jgi:hypothetical protein